MMVEARKQMNQAELLEELDNSIAYIVASVVKEIARLTNRPRGELVCPRCKSGTLRYSLAPNGHVRAVCDRTVTVKDGVPIKCLVVME